MTTIYTPVTPCNLYQEKRKKEVLREARHGPLAIQQSCLCVCVPTRQKSSQVSIVRWCVDTYVKASYLGKQSRSTSLYVRILPPASTCAVSPESSQLRYILYASVLPESTRRTSSLDRASSNRHVWYYLRYSHCDQSKTITEDSELVVPMFCTTKGQPC
jgi:hypothetical protein